MSHICFTFAKMQTHTFLQTLYNLTANCAIPPKKTGRNFPLPLEYSLTLLDGIPHGCSCAVLAGDCISYNERCETGRERILNFTAAIGTKPAVLKAFLPSAANVSLTMTKGDIAEYIEMIA